MRSPNQLTEQLAERKRLMAQAQKAFQNDQADETAKLCKELIAAEPDFVDAYLLLARVCMKTESAGKVIEVLTEALRIDPNCAQANFGIGLAYHTVPDPERAIPYYRETLRLDPNH